jgi:multidrug efflux system outer membrane protein
MVVHSIKKARYRKGSESYLNALVPQRALYAARYGLIGGYEGHHSSEA